ncbi:hypothetical protein BsIDN1_64240 [Bacillus safensis]|uniref:Flagellar basal body rod protein N-terminal domain-containing protein n=1 Tax=Bacillus safensis TaxID=561879 RepID=A0A5S9MMB3_BACIA|nr:hypothetical protein BsIDN1_64240 [Bacillus safensis]
MLRTMINAAVSMNEVQKQLDIISNNIANSETTGYRAKNTRFSELIRQQFNQVDEKKKAGGKQSSDTCWVKTWHGDNG